MPMPNSVNDLALGQAIASPISAFGDLLDKLFTSDDERLDKQAVLARIAQMPDQLQVMLNMTEAQHRSVFVAGWRPFIGWCCGFGICWTYLGHPIFSWAAALFWPGVQPPAISADHLMELVLAMLGMSGLRTFEKIKGAAS